MWKMFTSRRRTTFYLRLFWAMVLSPLPARDGGRVAGSCGPIICSTGWADTIFHSAQSERGGGRSKGKFLCVTRVQYYTVLGGLVAYSTYKLFCVLNCGSLVRCAAAVAALFSLFACYANAVVPPASPPPRIAIIITTTPCGRPQSGDQYG